MEKKHGRRGKFIVLEGGEGSGKGTAIDFLKERCATEFPGKEFVFTREPGGTEYGEELRGALLSPANKGKVTALSELLTFCAIRANHCDLLIRPALDAGKIVVCDRFYHSTIAYQIYGRDRKELRPVFERINSYAIGGNGKGGGLEPDLVIFLDVEPEIGLERIQRRKGELTRFDQEKLMFHKRVFWGYTDQYYDGNSDNWVRIDTGLYDIERMRALVFQEAKTLLAGG